MAKNTIVERRTIDVVPESERHGKVSNQFTLWMAANLQITAIVDGALAVAFGAEALTAIIALFIGNILGGIVMALHSAQGPHLGLPQMISSRAQFGVKGAVLPLVLVVLMYLGFAASGTILSGQAINLILGVQNPAIGILIFGILTAFIAIIGYKLIHIIGRVASVISILGFIYLGWRLFADYNVADAFGKQPFTIASFLLGMALSAGWQMTYAPYVADYSRYLPSNTSGKSTFWMTFLGTVISSQISMTFGVLLAALVGNEFRSNQVVFLGILAGPALAAYFAYFIIVAGKMTPACLNAYGGCMTMLTTVSTFKKNQHVSPFLRAGLIIVFVAISVMIALWGSADFLSKFKNFVLLLLAMFVPWSAVNLVDYYLISKEKVDVPALYDANGRYGAYGIPALVSYLIGVIVQIPFFNMAIYEGPLAKLMGGADISWIVSLIVTGVLFYFWGKKTIKVPDTMILPSEK
ncbi:cytosine permease [Bartonella sp. HY329]|uniref:purine-cytosine permease family protein n=1 Tax=unclassified Bartonella TaxID=2645622 RepID=UPI0021C8C17E|nr:MULTISPECIES: cytosine permease [unclassified Bartonella]UXM94737.1 cytosine permease [Bartonella sp. HY329]UXN09060.1 cytosine permease [Bartonella sp. HY328]